MAYLLPLFALILSLGAGCRQEPEPVEFSDLPQVSLDEVLPDAVTEHVVQGGETLSAIARRYGVGVQEIVNENPGIDPDRIRIGQKIRVPAGGR